MREQEAVVDKLKAQVREQGALRAQIKRLEEDLAKKPAKVTPAQLESEQPTASPDTKYVPQSRTWLGCCSTRARFLSIECTVDVALTVLWLAHHEL